MDPSEGPAPEIHKSSEVLEQVGEPLAVFKPNSANLTAWVVLGGLFGTFGLVVIVVSFFEPGPADRLKFMIRLFEGAGFALVGIALAYHFRRIFYFRILVYPEGLVRICRRQIDAFRWDEIASITEQVEEIRVAGLRSTTYTIRRRDGLEISVDRNNIKGISKLGKLLLEAAHRYDIPWHAE